MWGKRERESVCVRSWVCVREMMCNVKSSSILTYFQHSDHVKLSSLAELSLSAEQTPFLCSHNSLESHCRKNNVDTLEIQA